MVDTLNRLAATIAARKGADAGSSYTASLFANGLPKIAQKLGEEATETVIAAMQRDPKAVTGEAADLLFHLLVLLDASGVPLAEVLAELDRREGVSGLDEKASRTIAPEAEAAPKPLSAPAAPEPAPGIALGGPAPASRRRIRRG
ncbi:phosphoribosyl-ATP diphosphatase [Sphingomonas sp. CGMCC 1.13654]|uniref:Phosphoribosyl-ATP pyrophosphatase n=1 Tax=Sphingomonas chungangi TaxID=2683589 RepID=A0A838LBR3_9SPHN|nr:phosphoribosyl-ATP diphosphatase [Sphingomonas chungangi]MVW55428.1 phosphoribosyl-ATP diphosphatase [Sphingomonas chungangi]